MSFRDFLRGKLAPPRNAEEIAKTLTEKIANSSFDLIKNIEFRRLANFEKNSQVEQDRIFNEIVVTGQALAILMYWHLQEIATKDEAKRFFSELQLEMASRYGNWLKELGTPAEFADIWRDLIKMRTDEYKRDFHEHEKELLPDFGKNPFVYVAAIGGYKHITRGKGKAENPLYRFFLHWVIDIGNFIAKTTANATK